MCSKILILSITVGAGHTRAAEAMRDAILLKQPKAEVQIVDIFNYANPLIGKMVIGTYMEMIKMTPLLYRFLYTNAERNNNVNSSSKREFIKLLNKFTESKLIRLVDKFNPDKIVCTHPFPLGIMSMVKEKMGLTTPLFAACTDFTFHPFWVFDNVSCYVVGTEELKKDLIKFGVSEEIINVTGIPIDPKFERDLDKESLRKSFGLEVNIPVVLAMGGGLGLGPLKKIVKSLNALDTKLQLIVIAGKNKALQNSLLEMLPELKMPTKIYGFINNIHEFMEVSDLIITKPGGLTSSEALAKGLPMIIVSPIPGQEERNSDYLIKHQVAFRVDEQGHLPEALKEYIASPEKINKMKISAKVIGEPSSALKIADIILTDIKGGLANDRTSLPS